MEDTFPKLLLRNYQQWGGSAVALRKKEYGIWREYTWEDCYHRVKALFLGLVTAGLASGDKVSILSDSSPEWFWCELAVQTAGGVVIGLNPAASAEEAKAVLEQSESRFAIAQDQEQVDKLLEVKDALPSLQRIVYCNDKGLRHYDNPDLVSFAEVTRLGEDYERGHSGHFEESLSRGRGDDIAMILYVAGNSGSAKEVPATHRFLLSSVESALASNPVYASDDYVSVISPGWFFEQTLGFGASLLTGQKLNFAERAETAAEDLREISPQTLTYPSRVWDQIASAIQSNVGSGTWLKRTLFKRGLSLGYEVSDPSLAGHRSALFKRLLYRIADVAVFRPLRDKHGLNRARVVYTAGETVSWDTQRFFRAVGVSLQQIYASAEGGLATIDPGEERIT